MSGDATQTVDAEETLTIALSFAAIDALESPGAAIDDTRDWSEHVGIVSDRPAHRVINRIRQWDIYDEDFYPRSDKADTLTDIAISTDTERYVYVGTSEDDAEIAAERGWEYRSIEEAARAAGWDVTREDW